VAHFHSGEAVNNALVCAYAKVTCNLKLSLPDCASSGSRFWAKKLRFVTFSSALSGAKPEIFRQWFVALFGNATSPPQHHNLESIATTARTISTAHVCRENHPVTVNMGVLVIPFTIYTEADLKSMNLPATTSVHSLSELQRSLATKRLNEYTPRERHALFLAMRHAKIPMDLAYGLPTISITPEVASIIVKSAGVLRTGPAFAERLKKRRQQMNQEKEARKRGTQIDEPEPWLVEEPDRASTSILASAAKRRRYAMTMSNDDDEAEESRLCFMNRALESPDPRSVQSMDNHRRFGSWSSIPTTAASNIQVLTRNPFAVHALPQEDSLLGGLLQVLDEPINDFGEPLLQPEPVVSPSSPSGIEGNGLTPSSGSNTVPPTSISSATVITEETLQQFPRIDRTQQHDPREISYADYGANSGIEDDTDLAMVELAASERMLPHMSQYTPTTESSIEQLSCVVPAEPVVAKPSNSATQRENDTSHLGVFDVFEAKLFEMALESGLFSGKRDSIILPCAFFLEKFSTDCGVEKTSVMDRMLQFLGTEHEALQDLRIVITEAGALRITRK